MVGPASLLALGVLQALHHVRTALQKTDMEYHARTGVVMALIIPGPLIETISGSIGGTTFARSQAGPGVRRRTGPCDAGTDAELKARLVMSRVAKAWQQLSQTDQCFGTPPARHTHCQTESAGTAQ